MKTRHGCLLLGALTSSSLAHSWVEQLIVIAPNGTLIGTPGFPRGNHKRDEPGFEDSFMVHLLPGDDRTINQIVETDLMCKATQIQQLQTRGSPRLQASAGDNIALLYQENGHVSLPEAQPGKPDNGGTVYVYGTAQPRENDTFLSIHRVWNAEGTGGDGRGTLLSTRNYDDGQCYQVNDGQISVARRSRFPHVPDALMGADLWCQQDIQIPIAAPSGKPYTLYWVWDWPTMPGTAGFLEGKQEIYTTCMDVDLIDRRDDQEDDAQGTMVGHSLVSGLNPASAGIASQLIDIKNPTAVIGTFISFTAVSGEPRMVISSSVQSSPTVQPIVASNGSSRVSQRSYNFILPLQTTDTTTTVLESDSSSPTIEPIISMS